MARKEMLGSNVKWAEGERKKQLKSTKSRMAHSFKKSVFVKKKLTCKCYNKDCILPPSTSRYKVVKKVNTK